VDENHRRMEVGVTNSNRALIVDKHADIRVFRTESHHQFWPIESPNDSEIDVAERTNNEYIYLYSILF